MPFQVVEWVFSHLRAHNDEGKMKTKKKVIFLLVASVVIAVIFSLRLMHMGYGPRQVLPSAAVLLVFLLLVPLLRVIAPP